MELDRYKTFKSNKEHVYEFYSEGPRVKIKKLIKFTLIELDIVFNFGFGDENLRNYENNGHKSRQLFR